MASNIDRSLNDIIRGYGPVRTGGSHEGQRDTPYTSKPKPTQVFVGNLPWSTKWQDLKDLCKKFGEVKRADVAEEGGRSKGYGIVVFKTVEAAQDCIKGLHGEILDGRDLTVKLDTKPNVTERVLQKPKIGLQLGGVGMVLGNHFLQAPNVADVGMMGGEGAIFSPQTNAECQVFVGNLPWSVKWQDLKDLCKPFGMVKRADIAEDNGRSKGFGIVVFDSAASAQACVSGLNGNLVDGRALNVKIDEKPDQGIAYGGGGGMQLRLTAPGSRMGGGFSSVGGGGGMQFGEHGQHTLTAPGSMGGRFSSGGGGGGMQFGQHNLTAPGGIGGGGCIVFIGNIPWSTKWQDLKDMCNVFGNVVRADVEENEEGKSKGYGIVKFSDAISAQNCIANLNGQIYEGRDLSVHLDKFDGVASGKGAARVFVGNLPWSFKRWQDLKDLCRNFGDVIRAEIEEQEDGRSKGYGIVTFTSAVGAQNCINNLNGQLLSGRPLVVRIDRYNKKANGSSSKKGPANLNWNEEVPDQETLDAELDNYYKSRVVTD